jgi:hypothetical protein
MVFGVVFVLFMCTVMFIKTYEYVIAILPNIYTTYYDTIHEVGYVT